MVGDAPRLRQAAAIADALVVRNRTQVRGIQAIPAVGVTAPSVDDYVLTSALVLLRGAYAATPAVAAGQWPRQALSKEREAAGKAPGLIGSCSIGQLSARLARAPGMRVMAFDSMMDRDHPAFGEGGVACAGLDEVIRTADVVSLHVPLVDSTRGLFDAARISSMKRGAVLINTARGGIVDEPTLAAALRSGHLGGAAIDVFAEEPLPASTHFEGCPNLLLTPHDAGLTAESNVRVSALIADRLLEVLACD